MHFYIRHIGDYARDTANLSALEVGVYDLMLDFYYSTEQPLPLNRTDLKTLARSRNVATVRAMDKVLTEFFQKTERGYTHHRVEEELAKARSKSSKAAAAAAARWEAEKRDANASKGDAKKHANAYANASGENMRTHRSSNASHKPVVNLKPKTKGNSTAAAQPTRTRTRKKGDAVQGDSDAGTNVGKLVAVLRSGGMTVTPSNPDLRAAAQDGMSEALLAVALTEARAAKLRENLGRSATLRFVLSVANRLRDEGIDTAPNAGHAVSVVKANGHGPPQHLTPVQEREAEHRAFRDGIYRAAKGNTGEVIDIEAKETGNERRLKNS